MRTVRGVSGGVDIMEPREVYYALKEAWKEMDEISVILREGWNLISIPLILDDNSVDNVFADISYSFLFSYDSEWKVPTEINYTIGYWIDADNDDILTVKGLEPVDTIINLNDGWNLVGYPYLEEKDVSELFENNIVYSYNGSWSSYIPGRTFNSLQILKAGLGYWVKK